MSSVKHDEMDQHQDGQLPEVTTSFPGWLRGGILVVAKTGRLSASQWLQAQKEWALDVLKTRGAILLRDFRAISLTEFETIATALGGEPPQAYENRSTPRSTVEGNIFTSTEYPASASIPLHNENSYSSTWPNQIFFLCSQPATRGGETPIADSRRVYSSISEDTRQQFASKGVLYVRNYGRLGLSWQETFQMHDREKVEEYCTLHDIQWDWNTPEELRTWQALPAVRQHPATGEYIWFNQAHLFHASNLADVGTRLLSELGKDHMPRHALFGDGTEIPSEALREIRLAYENNATSVRWSQNDLLVLDNMLWAHGRRPFLGPRRILVAMTKMVRHRAR